jgi:hypothetical protein
MIGRKTALVCAALVAVMVAAALWRILALADWTTLAVHNGATLPSLLLFFFPACSALVAGGLFWNGTRGRADAAKLQAWRQWGEPLAIAYCGGMLLLQGVLIVASLDLHRPWHLSQLARGLGLVMAIIALLAVNRMPKLPYFERAFGSGVELGPIYGPRYVRIVSRILVAFMIAVIAYSLAAAPGTAWPATLMILLATACLMIWSIAWRRQLGRKWSLEQMAQRGREG